MSEKSSSQKTTQRNSRDSNQTPAAGPDGLSIAPPVYGKDTPPVSAPTLQRKAAPSAGDEAPNRTGLPDVLKTGIESLSNMSLDDVRVHTNSSKPAQLNAFAYAQGADIHVAPGQERHLPHEAWHVVQQKQGRVKPTLQMKNTAALNDDDGLEHEADTMGEKALHVAPQSKPRFSIVQPTGTVLQLAPKADKKNEEKEKGEKIKWTSAGKKDGEFLGDPATFHIHRAGGNEHFKYGSLNNTRVDFNKKGRIRQANLVNAIDTCQGLNDSPAQRINTMYKGLVLSYLRSLLPAGAAAPAAAAAAPPAARIPGYMLPPVTNFDDI